MVYCALTFTLIVLTSHIIYLLIISARIMNKLCGWDIVANFLFILHCTDMHVPIHRALKGSHF